ncbi:hypothetical protein OGAPHI_005290 [Ogataea philodendri]|uniref:Guanine nucleotide-binding protein subunit gamma n=1 Tax=Ogataea philodendri TaxID=1378263 RepID=A0A9P8P288_9ASCO|nr:uncharacterized protein OGAPHI_005290 [Ogataea philodendri]KAH3663887.1 hypothetical protein OGAPHI_005290 [Ogataea philodendri]
MELGFLKNADSAPITGPEPENEKLMRIIQLNKMKSMKLERLNQYNNRLKRELARERVNASNSSLMIIKYTETTKDGLIPELWGPTETRYQEKTKSPNNEPTGGCCTIA